ncbi:MAG TPA: AMP-binding protein, partial [Actinomycetota bacterium]|nr:AMP-binding protein [Actinomycetota bacterium]
MRSARKSDLIAVTAPPSAAWLTWLRRAWDAGSAVLPIDHRLTRDEQDALIARARPTAIFDGAQLVRIDGEPVAEDVALVVATSGSAGEPKAAELTHDALRAAVLSSAERLGVGASDSWVCCLPVAHMGGMLVLLRHLILGADVQVQAHFDPVGLARSGAGCTSVVPTMVARIHAAGETLSQFKVVLVGGAALDPTLHEPTLVRTYGMTESCGGVVYDGRALNGVGVRIRDDDEIQVSGPTLMRGYRLSSPQPFTADGWLRTRDAGSWSNGVLTVFGRLDDAIVTGGEKVWPQEVEDVLRAHPAIADVAVVGRRDPEWGSAVTALVVPTDAAEPPSLDVLRAFVAERLARFKAPRALELVSSIPRTRSGKIARRGLI